MAEPKGRRQVIDELTARIGTIRIGTRRAELDAVEGWYVATRLHCHLVRGDPRYADEDLPKLEERLRNPDTRDDAIMELLTTVGPDVLASTLPLLDIMKDGSGVRQRIRDLIHARIRECYAASRLARNEDVRSAARMFFERFSLALIGPQHGRRKAAVRDQAAVVEFYYRVLFRLQVARKLMSEPAELPRKRKLREVAKTCRLRLPHVEAYFLTSTGEPRRPITIEAQARLWTGERFKIKQQAVSNMLIKPRRRQSSKSP